MVLFHGWGLTASRLQPLQGGSLVHSWSIHLSISNISVKTEYTNRVVQNITFSKDAGQDNNITGQTISEYVLFYFNIHLFATIVSMQGIWEVRSKGVYTHPPH